MFKLGDTVTFKAYRSECGDRVGYPVFESELRDHDGQTATVTKVTRFALYGVTFDDGYEGEAVFADELTALPCPHDDVEDTGDREPDGSHIYVCAACGERWNEPEE